MESENFRQGLKHGLPIWLGYFPVSFAYGMSVVLSGMPAWAAVLISLTNLTSAGQFAGSSLMLAGGGYLEIALTTVIINIRYFLMSLALSQKVDEKMTGVQRLLVSFGITDEIFAVSMQNERKLTASYLAGLILTPMIGWTGGTLAGGILTSFLPTIVTNALSIALYGMFIAVIIPPSRKKKSVLFTVLFAVLLSCCFHYFPVFSVLSGGWGIIVITLVVSAVAAVLFPIEVEEVHE